MPSISGNGITVDFDVVLTEKVNRSGKVTSSPIEGNMTVSDHFAVNQVALSISGVCTTDGANKIANLVKLFNMGGICHYSGRNGAGNVVITSLNTDHGRNYDKSFAFTMTLIEIKTSATKEFSVGTATTQAQNSAQINSQTSVGAASPVTKNVDATTNANANNKALSSASTYTN